MYDQDYAAIAPLAELAARRSVCLLLVHHVRKAADDDPISTISGTLAIAGAADGLLVLERRRASNVAVLHCTGRDAIDQQLAMSWDEQSCTWTLAGNAVDAKRMQAEALAEKKAKEASEKAQAKLERHCQQIVTELVKLPEGQGATKQTLSDSCGLATIPLRNAIAALLQDAVIVKCEVARENGQTYPGFKLATQTHSDSSRLSTPTIGVTSPARQSSLYRGTVGVVTGGGVGVSSRQTRD